MLYSCTHMATVGFKGLITLTTIHTDGRPWSTGSITSGRVSSHSHWLQRWLTAGDGHFELDTGHDTTIHLHQHDSTHITCRTRKLNKHKQKEKTYIPLDIFKVFSDMIFLQVWWPKNSVKALKDKLCLNDGNDVHYCSETWMAQLSS